MGIAEHYPKFLPHLVLVVKVLGIVQRVLSTLLISKAGFIRPPFPLVSLAARNAR